MKVYYEPKGASLREFAFKPLGLMSYDAEAIEEVGGDTWDNYDGFLAALQKGRIRALRAILWLNLRREKPGMSFSELVVQIGELRYGPDEEEIAEAKKRIMEDPDLSEKDRAEILAELGKDDAEGTSVTSDSATGSPSLATDSGA